MPVIRSSRLTRFLLARLTPGGELGLHLTVGAALLLAALAVFGEVAEWMRGQTGLARVDIQLSQWLHEHAREPWTTLMLAMTHLHSVAGIIALTLALAIYFRRRQLHYWLLALLVTVPAGMVLNVLVKHAYQRVRPTFADPLLTLSTYSFPSGHTASATLFYGVLACYLATVLPRAWQRVAAIFAAALMVSLVALSRMYLGAHYLTDVLAAMAEGVAWLAICITAVSTLRRRRQRP
jgi:membrane-associated phospholipid phosphatase